MTAILPASTLDALALLRLHPRLHLDLTAIGQV
jgi:hypothetical protein